MTVDVPGSADPPGPADATNAAGPPPPGGPSDVADGPEAEEGGAAGDATPDPEGAAPDATAPGADVPRAAISAVTLRTAGRRPRLLSRRRVALVVVVAVTGLAVSGYASAKVRLADTRDQLADVRVDLADTRDEVEVATRRTELAEGALADVRGDIDAAVADRTWLDAVTAGVHAQIAAVEEDRAETDTAQMLVTANSADSMTCFGGVASAVRANRVGDDQASIGALRAAADQCGRTLALATGARFPFDFADPFVLRTGDAYYGYSTNAGAGDVQVIRSSDLVGWELVGNALPTLPGWAVPGATWAPSVLARDGGYVVYYTVREASSQRQCISRGVASSPAGPYRDDSTGPLVCQRELGGSIDPSPFVDADGRAWLLWKAEGTGGPAQTIWSQELTPDGRGLVGPAHPLVSADRSFERGVVEAPSLVREGGAYLLVYAAADWNSRGYAAAYATCTGPAGPCTKPADGRILTSGSRLAGPGGVEVFRDRDGALWAAFHAFSEPNVGYPSSRYLHVARLRVVDGRPVIDAAT